MTRNECIEQLYSLEAEFFGEIKQFTIDLFDSKVADIRNEEYTTNEEESLASLSYHCENILKIMKPEIVDNYVISRLHYILEKRLKTIYNERR